MENKKDSESSLSNETASNPVDYFSFLLVRAEKLSSAVYLLTSLLSDMEPIKWVIREKSLSLLSDISAAEHAALSDRMVLFETAEESVREMASLISIARSGQIISSMNADVLIAALHSFRETIGRGVGVPTSAESIVAELLKGDERSLLDQPEIFKGQKNNKDIFRQQHITGLRGADYKTNDGAKKYTRNDIQSSYSAEKIRAERKKTIVDFIRKRKEVTIKDVVQVVSNCSEKTIQRELTTLVKDNVLKKEGERRWSRYSLK